MKSIKLCRTLLTSLFLLSVFTLSHSVSAATQSTQLSTNDTTINSGIDLNTPLNVDLIDSPNVKQHTARRYIPKQVILQIPFQTQINHYYCGPAAAAMVVNSLGYHKTQHQMASLLNTTRNGTNAGNGVANALNAVVRGSKYQFRWSWHRYNQIDKMKNHIIEALSYGNPVMVNTAESPGDVYLSGHNIGMPLYHYGVIGDYFNYGNTVTYTDPGYGRVGGFVMDQQVSIRNMSYAAGTRGYAW